MNGVLCELRHVCVPIHQRRRGGEDGRRAPRRGPHAAALLGLLALAACVHLPPPTSESVLGAVGGTPGLPAVAFAAPPKDGNRVEILTDGDAIFDAQLAAIAGARRSITYAQFVFRRGSIPAAYASAFASRCRAGVRVHVLLDAWGARPLPDSYTRWMRDAGCEVVPDFRPLGRLGEANYRNHRRILVVDGRIGFTGGTGVAPSWRTHAPSGHRWRDTSVRIEGPVVAELQAAFVEQWREATGRTLGGPAYFPPLAPAGGVRARIVRSAPLHGDYAMYALVLGAIASARRALDVTNPYLVLDDQLRGALVAAARRGVRVRILIPGPVPDRFLSRLVHAATLAHLEPLLRAGVEVFEYEESLLHAKTMVVDGSWGMVGSTNLDPRSFALNDELVLVFENRGLARELAGDFATDLAHARPLTLARWRERPWRVRLLAWLAHPVRGML